MIKLLLLIIYIWLQKRRGGKLQKEVVAEVNKEDEGEEALQWLSYSPDFISDKEIEESVQEMSKYAFKAAMLIYTQISALLGSENTVLQFQMYGLGHIWRKGIRDYNSNGTFQLTVAFKIVSKLKKKFGNITMTSQEPRHLPVEIEYLQKMNVHVFDRRSFSPDHFINAISESGAQEPVMICYMIHFDFAAYELFLEAHWTPEILSKIIFVGYWCGDPFYAKHLISYKKATMLSEFMTRKTLPFELPIYEKSVYEEYWGYPPFQGHPSDFLSYKAFHLTNVYRISYENAKKMMESQ